MHKRDNDAVAARPTCRMRDIFILLKQKYYRIYLFSPLFREHLCAFDLYLILFNIYPIHTSLYIYIIYYLILYGYLFVPCYFHFLAVARNLDWRQGVATAATTTTTRAQDRHLLWLSAGNFLADSCR